MGMACPSRGESHSSPPESIRNRGMVLRIGMLRDVEFLSYRSFGQQWRESVRVRGLEFAEPARCARVIVRGNTVPGTEAGRTRFLSRQPLCDGPGTAIP